ncbi:MAG: fructosamine kinase family protein [Flavobacteriales bacterium]
MIPQSLKEVLVDGGFCSARQLQQAEILSGGDTCLAARIPGQTSDTFLKWSTDPSVCRSMPAERDSLHILGRAGAHVPDGVALFESGGASGLIMEYLPASSWSAEHTASLVEQLERVYQAPLSLAPVPQNATIGSVPVEHGGGELLGEWYLQMRIHPLAIRCKSVLGEELYARVLDWALDQKDALSKPRTWVHGDLWSGNAHCAADGNVYLIDPVCHHAYPELDLAMMDLFGGFPPQVATELCSSGILDPEWRSRLGLWQLIPALVHVATFGGGYRGMVQRIVTS